MVGGGSLLCVRVAGCGGQPAGGRALMDMDTPSPGVLLPAARAPRWPARRPRPNGRCNGRGGGGGSHTVRGCMSGVYTYSAATTKANKREGSWGPLPPRARPRRGSQCAHWQLSLKDGVGVVGSLDGRASTVRAVRWGDGGGHRVRPPSSDDITLGSPNPDTMSWAFTFATPWDECTCRLRSRVVRPQSGLTCMRFCVLFA